MKDAGKENNENIDGKDAFKALHYKDYKPAPPPKPKRTTIWQQKHPLLLSLLSADNLDNQQHYHGTLMHKNSGLLIKYLS